MKKIFFLLFIVLVAKFSFAQLTISRWTFESVTTSNTGTSPIFSGGSAVADGGARTTGSLCTGVHTSATSTWSNPSGTGSSKSISSNGWASGDYYQFQTTANGCSGISLTWDQISSSSGPKSWKVQYSTDGTTYTDVPNSITNFTYDVATDTWNNTTGNSASTRTVNLGTITNLNNAANIYFRLVVAAGSTGVGGAAIASTGTGRVDNFTISGSVIAPLNLNRFNASLLNKQASLAWSTSNEINVNGFEIERSNDGTSFNNVGFIAANNTARNNYLFTDVVSINTATYYRLKMIDKDGSFKYSPTVVLNGKASIKLDVFPNPVTNSVIVSHAKAGTNGAIKIVTVDGRNIITYNVQTSATQSNIDVSKLTKGNYLVVFENDGTRVSTQLVKQ